LAGVVVIELAGLGPVQYGGMMLADHGAEVIRVDRITDGDEEDPRLRETAILQRGRRSIAVDLKSDEGRRILDRLVAKADVLIDPYRPGVLERLGLDPERLLGVNPRLIVARMTGWGQTGPLADAAGHDLNYLAVSGALGLIGEPDRPPPVPLNLIGDFGAGGMMLCFGIVAALFERERSGRGQVLDVAMVDGIASLLGSIFQLQASGRWEPGRGSNWLQGGAPWYRAYEASDDRFVSVAAYEPQFYARLLEVLKLDPGQWPQWDRARWGEQAEDLAAIFSSAPRDAWVERFAGVDCCFAPVLDSAEVLAAGHLRERGAYVTVAGVDQPAPAPLFERTSGAIGWPPPGRGDDSLEILGELGFETAEIEGLRAARAVA
jgi:alpha-methylacyl-CoA racemase